METKPEQAQKIIHDTQRLLATEQSELRAHINELRPNLNCTTDQFDLDRRIGDLIERIGRQWENISLKINNPAKTPPLTKGLGREIYFIIHESVINAVRHSGATEIVVDLDFTATKVHIMVADNGSGFLFHGRFDHKTLSTLKRGPVTLRERVTELGGTLAIDSRETGARLDIFLPLTVNGR
jgi:two-component system sensor histidine kinase DegS